MTVFDKTDKLGGMVTHGIADFRIPDEAIENDIALIKKMGMKFELNADPVIDVKKLKAEGYKYIHIAIGAWKSRALPIEGDLEQVLGAIKFLRQFKKHPKGFNHAAIRSESISSKSSYQKDIKTKPFGSGMNLGKNVAIVGAGNSAMDAARAAKRVDGVENVTIFYRRSRKQMPATREEFLETQHEGIIFRELLNPAKLENGVLTCQQMKLGEKDDSGRRRPLPVDGEFLDFEIDTVIAAIGELVDYELLNANEIKSDKWGNIEVDKYKETSVENVYIGGDAYRGPASIIEALADGKKVAEGIFAKEGVVPQPVTAQSYEFDTEKRLEAIAERKATLAPRLDLENFEVNFTESANRCLSCNVVCNKCTEVCPNIANIPIKVEGMTDVNQILHLEGLCNECGNCAVFCPFDSDPAKDKFTLYWRVDEFEKGAHEGYVYTSENSLKMRYAGDIYDLTLKDGEIDFADATVQVNAVMLDTSKLVRLL